MGTLQKYSNCELEIMISDAYRRWSESDFTQMERLTGFRQIDFDPEDGYQDFVDACDSHWNRLCDEEKVLKWEDYDNN
jgi:hypothetical protein